MVYGGGVPLVISNVSNNSKYDCITMKPFVDKLTPDSVLSKNEIDKLQGIENGGNPIIIKISLKE